MIETNVVEKLVIISAEIEMMFCKKHQGNDGRW